MTSALWLLIGLQARGWVRYGLRGLATPKGALLALLGGAIFVPWILSFWLAPTHGRGLSAEQLRIFGPAALAGYCVLNVFLTAGENALYFTPAEVSFLFSAPLSRRQLLAYKLASTAMVGVPTSFLMALVFRPHAGSYVSALVGIILVFGFVHLFGMTLYLLVSAIGAPLFQRGRRAVTTFLLVLGGIGLFIVRYDLGPRGLDQILSQIARSPAWQVVFLPFSWYIETILAKEVWPDLVVHAILCLFINGGLVAVVFFLDTLNLESIASSSARLYTRIQRLRGRTVEGASEEEAGFRATCPALPHWGGIGTILWRQLTTALRQPGRLFLTSLPFIFILIGPIISAQEDNTPTGQLVPLLVAGVLWVALFITALVPYDFRGDLDRMVVLKGLPIAPWRMVIGQLLTPVLLIAFLQGVVLTCLFFLIADSAHLVIAGAIFLLPFNFLLFGVENLLFLLFPVRLVGANPGDFQTVGKNVLFLLARVMSLGLVCASAGFAAFATFWLTHSQILAGGMAWSIVVVADVCLVPLIGIAFTAFDVTRDVPA